MATAAAFQDRPPMQDTDDASDDTDACSISSNPDRPAWAAPIYDLPWHQVLELPEADAIRRQMEKMQPTLRLACAPVRNSIRDLMLAAELTLVHKYLRRDVLALCTRVLAFFDDLLQAGLGSASSVSPGTAIHFVLQVLAIRLAQLMNVLCRSLHRWDESYARRKLRPARYYIQKAQGDVKTIVSDARKTLGLVSKPYRIAYGDFYLPYIHPFAQPSLPAAFADQLLSLRIAFLDSDLKFERRPTFPDALFYTRLYTCLRNISISRPYPPERASSASQDGYSSSDEGSSDGDSDQHESDEEDDDNGSDIPDQIENPPEFQINPDTYLDFVLMELDPHRLAFLNIEELGLWRRLATMRTNEIAARQRNGWDPLDEVNSHQLLAMLIIETCKMECFESAAIFVELLVIHYRFQLAQEPGHFLKKADLCSALALFSVVLSRCDDRRRPEGVKVIEEAQSLFSTLRDASLPAGQFDAMTATFSVLHGHALFNKGSNEGIGHRPLWDVRKALRSACSGLEGLQAFHAKNPTSKMLLAAVARAAHSAANIGLHLLKVTEAQQDAHTRCIKEFGLDVPKPPYRQKRPFPPFPFYKGWCAATLEPVEQFYIHAKMGDFSLGTVDDFERMAGIAVDAYRELVAHHPEQIQELDLSEWRVYEPLLAQALHLRAELLDLRPTEAIPCAEEAIEIYTRLSESFPAYFDPSLAQLYRDHFARHLYAENDLPRARAALEQAIHYRSLEREEWMDARVLVDLRVTRAMVCGQLERYDDALDELDTAEEEANRDERDGAIMQRPRARIAALRAFCLWMKGDAAVALTKLEEVQRPIEARAEKRWARARAWQNGDEDESAAAAAAASQDPDEILFLGWLGGARAAAAAACPGGHSEEMEHARREVEEVVRQARELRKVEFDDDEDGVSAELVVKEALVPLPRVLTHLLVLLAAICAQIGEEHKEAAMKSVEEALALSGEDHTACDLSTLKTAMLLRRRLCGVDADVEEGREREALAPVGSGDVASEDRSALRGFLAQLGFSRTA
ncbi:hypothetical protein OC835_001577 [Tilletia horrida]|nr:hypothetical protein OC835_001577 [Tilletia horrida]